MTRIDAIADRMSELEALAAVTGGLGYSVRRATLHPGPIQDWRARYYTEDLFTGSHRDVNFYQEERP